MKRTWIPACAGMTEVGKAWGDKRIARFLTRWLKHADRNVRAPFTDNFVRPESIAQ